MDRYAAFPQSTNIDDRRGDPPMDPLDAVVAQFRAGPESSRSSIPEPRGNYSQLQAQGGLPALDMIEKKALADFVAQPWRPGHGPLRADMRANPDAPPASIERPVFDESLRIAQHYLRRGLISPAEYQRLADRISLARMAEQTDQEFLGEPSQ